MCGCCAFEWRVGESIRSVRVELLGVEEVLRTSSVDRLSQMHEQPEFAPCMKASGRYEVNRH